MGIDGNDQWIESLLNLEITPELGFVLFPLDGVSKRDAEVSAKKDRFVAV